MNGGADHASWQHQAARVVTASYAVATAAAVGRLVFGRHGPDLHDFGTFWDLAFGLLNIPVASSFLSVVVLYLTTRALAGRKRVGLWLVCLFQLAGIAIGMLAALPVRLAPTLDLWRSHDPVGRVLDVIGAVVGIAALTVLWRLRPLFNGRVRRGSWGLALITGLVGTAVTGTVMWLLLGVQSTNRQQLDGMLDTVTDVLSGQYHGWFTGVRPWVVDITTLLAGLTLITTATVFLASGRSRDRWTADRELQLRELLAGYGAEDSLGYFNTRRDRSALFSTDGRAAITYRVVAGVCLAAADPIGDRAAWPQVIRNWRAEAARFGWRPAVLAASEDGARAYAAAGMRILRLGDEAVLDAASFSTRRPELAEVRRAAAHARRAGVVVRIRRQSAISADERAALAAAAQSWLDAEPDRGFSMALNRPDDPADGRVLVVTAECAGALVGLLRFVPWGRRDVSLDTMRHAGQAPSGVTELMVTELMASAERLGIQRVSLNFCMFRGVFAEAQRLGSRSLTKLNAGMLGFLDRFWQLERLYRATRKYEPDWVPRFLCYDDPLTLPRVGLAAAAAEGFVPWPTAVEHPPEPFPVDQLTRLAAIESAPTDVARTPRRNGEQSDQRMAVVRSLVAAGMDPYPAAGRDAVVPHTPVSLCRLWQDGWQDGRQVTVIGRIRSLRDHGGVVFADLADGTGCDGTGSVQLLLESGRVDDLGRFRAHVDTGDLVLFSGVLGRSRNGTPSLLVDDWEFRAKALHPIPWSILGDPERRLVDRSADLIVHPDDLDIIRKRSAAIAAVRHALIEGGFLEVETPILHTVHGGARARPFRTRMQGSDRDLTLRIAPELYLKQLLVAGCGPVFEIGRNFRNEGSDTTHNPEFTSLEAYQPGGDYTTMRKLAQRLIVAAASAVYGKPVIPLPRSLEQTRAGVVADPTDISRDWPVVPFLDAVSDAIGEPVDLNTDPARLVRLAARHDVPLPGDDTDPGTLLEALYGKLVEPATMYPTFYVDFPRSTSPLTRAHRRSPGLVERWDLVAAGMEIGTAYTELTDPVDQRQRLTEQSLRAVAGDPEAMQVDEAFLYAMELGMPPAGGLGLGIDRLVMLLTNRPIRSVLTFPFTRPKGR